MINNGTNGAYNKDTKGEDGLQQLMARDELNDGLRPRNPGA